MVAGWNLLTNDAAVKRKVREIRAGVTEDDDPLLVEVSFFNHLYGPLTLGVEIEEDVEVLEECLRVNVICIPTGLHLPPHGDETKWHPTGEMVDGVPELRQVPHLVSAEEAKVMSGPLKPSRVEHGPVAAEVPEGVTEGALWGEPVEGPNVTTAEIAMARAEAKAMREAERVDQTTDEERKIWGGIASRRTDRRIDTSWLWGDGKERVVRSPVMPTSPKRD